MPTKKRSDRLKSQRKIIDLNVRGFPRAKDGRKNNNPFHGKPGPGVPRMAHDLELVRKGGKLHCTQEELGALLGCTQKTVSNRMADDPEFRAAFELGMAEGNLSLRRKQRRMALDGCIPLLIWLGKQQLGQREPGIGPVGNGQGSNPTGVLVVPMPLSPSDWSKQAQETKE